MKDKIVIAIDGDGGDNAPHSIVESINLYSQKYDNVFFQVFSVHNDLILPENCELIHVTDVITSDMNILTACKLKNSSMVRALLSVKNGNANAVLSCGNTGAYIMLARHYIGLIDNIQKAAICVMVPNINHGETIMLDLGANISYSPEDLVNFARMGEALYNSLFNSQARIALLNIGSESIKGTKKIRDANQLLLSKKSYIGFIEPNDILNDKSDVIVSNGFSGNIALKSMEGLMKIVKSELRDIFQSNFLNRIFSFIYRKRLKQFKKKWSNKNNSGGVILGLRNIVVKAHGSSNATNIFDAIVFTVRVYKISLIEKLCSNLSST